MAESRRGRLLAVGKPIEPLTGTLTLSTGQVLELDGYALHIASLVGIYRCKINEELLVGNREVTAVCQPRKVWLRFSETTQSVALGDAKT